ncbi:MAG: metallophosphatase family protein [Gemmatimonadetes bacterium]|nr:metallophosphatase family protein [Gemmatimonadota bacterium]
MRIALIADIHGNLPALEAVLDDVTTRGASATCHLGDLVGYAPWPNEVVALLRARAIPGVAGNYDSTVANDHPHCGCRYEDDRQEALSHESYAWTRSHVTAETKAALRALPFRLDIRPAGGHAAGRSLILVHATPTLNTPYWTQDRSDRFREDMIAKAGGKAGDAIAFGHTHVPWHAEHNGVHLVNAGSVGRPRDGDWRACYALVEFEAGRFAIDFVRVPYEIERAVAAIHESDLPNELATILRTGGSLAGSDVR